MPSPVDASAQAPPPPAPPHAAGRLRALDRALLTGLAWTGGARWVTQVISWAATLVVARLLSPADYGIAGMAVVYIALVQLVSEFGLGAAIVQRRDLSEATIARLGGASILLGGVFLLASLGAATPVARFYGEPRVRDVVAVLSLAFLTAGVQVVPRSLMRRDLEFRRLAWLDSAEVLTATAVTLALALLGLRYWALVIAQVTGRVTAAALACAWRPHRVAWPAPWRTIAEPVGFGGHVVLASLAWYVYRNADALVIGRMLGSAALGAYNMAASFASIPVDRVTTLVSQVAPPVFSTVQRDAAALRRYLLGLTAGVALVTFPAAVGLALVAPHFVPVVLGSQWTAAIAPLQVLSLATAARSVFPLLSQLLVATGDPKRNMIANVAAMLVLPPLFVVGARWGLVGVAAVWALGFPLVSLSLLVRSALRRSGVTAAGYAHALRAPLGGVLALTAVVAPLMHVLPEALPLPLRLAIEVAAGVLAYAGYLVLAHRDDLRAIWSVVRSARE